MKRKVTGRKRKTELSIQDIAAIEYHIRGMSRKEAMRRAGFPENSNKTSHVYLFGTQLAKDYMAKRRKDILNQQTNPAGRAQHELAKVAFFNIGEIMNVDADGNMEFAFEKATMDHLAAIQTVEFVKGKARVTPYNKLTALRMLLEESRLANGENKNLEEIIRAGRERLAKKPDRVVDGELIEMSGRDIEGSTGNSGNGVQQ